MPLLTWVDGCLIGLIGLSGLIGLVRGLIREVFSLAAWGAAVWVGLRYDHEVAGYLETAIPLPSARLAVAFALLFIATLAVAGLAAVLLSKLVQHTGLSGVDRLAGLVFGTARGVLVVAVLVLLAGATPLPEDSWWKESKLIPPFQSLSLWLRDQIPMDYASRIKSSIVSRR
jgi:membrane protein required for colicin V production